MKQTFKEVMSYALDINDLEQIQKGKTLKQIYKERGLK